MDDLARFIQLAKEYGAHDAKIIDAATVRTAAWVQMKCLYGCGVRGLHCPPNTPSYKQTQEMLDCYRTALLVHGKKTARPGSFIVKLERDVFLAGYYKAFAFKDGPCQLCAACNGKECVQPREARPSMEACGIDVYETARGNGFPIEVVKDRSDDRNFYGLLLIE